MTNETNKNSAQVIIQLSDGLTAEEVNEAVEERRKAKKTENLVADGKLAVTRLRVCLAHEDYADRLEPYLAEARELRAKLHEAGGYRLTGPFDRDVLNLVYNLIEAGLHDHVGDIINIVKSNFAVDYIGNQDELTVQIRLALSEYALANTFHDKSAKLVADVLTTNAGGQNAYIEGKIRGMLSGSVTPEEAASAAQLEVNRQIWRYINFKGENPIYLKTACENLMTARESVESPADLKLIELLTLLRRIRVGS